MKTFLKNLFFFISVPLAGRLKDQASILMYHSVSERRDYFFTATPSCFRAQLSYLKKRGVPVVSLAELVRRLSVGEPIGGAVCLTFDDGYRDNYVNAFPLLKEFGFPATIFVTTDAIGELDKRGMERLSIAEMREMADSGLVSFAPHSKTHPKLSTLSKDAAREEIEGSRRLLAEMLSTPSDYFAYPYGDYSDETVSLLKELGFSCALTVEPGLISKGSRLLELPRNSVDSATTLPIFKGLVSPVLSWYVSLHSHA